MAQQRKTVREPGEIDSDLIDDEPEMVSNLPAKLSDQILQAWEDDDISLTVSRRLKNGRKTAFLFEIDEYEDLPTLMSTLRDEYDGGEFLIEGRRQNGSWALKQAINVERPKKQEKEIHHNGQQDIAALIMAMNESAKNQADLMREQMFTMQQTMMNAQLESAKSQSEMLLRMMEMQNNKKESNSINDVVQTLTLLKSLEGEKTDPMEMLIKGMEMGRELGSGSGDENILQTALKTLGGPLVKMAEQMQHSQPHSAPQMMSQPQPQPQLQPQSQSQQLAAPKTSQTEASEMQQFLPVFNKIIEAAAINAPVEPVVDYAIENLPDSILAAYIIDDNMYGQLYAYQPMLTSYKPWLDKFRRSVIEWFNGEGEPDSESADNVSGQSSPSNVSGGEEFTDTEHSYSN